MLRALSWIAMGLLAAGAIAACGSEAAREDLHTQAGDGLGVLRLDLVLDVARATEAHYRVEGPGIDEPLIGALPVVDDAVRGRIDAVAAGPQRAISVFVLREQEVVCSGRATVDVAPLTVASIDLALLCTRSYGRLEIEASYDPRVTLDAASIELHGGALQVPLSVPLKFAYGRVWGVLTDIDPAGDYVLTLHAGFDGTDVCTGQRHVAVVAEQSTQAKDWLLTCRWGPGSVDVAAAAGVAPRIHSLGGDAAAVEVEGRMQVFVIASDEEQRPLTYRWSAFDGKGAEGPGEAVSSGVFGAPSEAVTVWSAAGLSPGLYVIRATVDNGAFASTQSIEVRVYDPPPHVVINELLYDGVGTDSHEAFVEMVGPANKVLDGFRLVGVNGADGRRYRTVSLDGVRLDDLGMAVIAHPDAEEFAPDLAAVAVGWGDVDFQNGPDAVMLVTGDDVIVDAVGYGLAVEGRPAVEVEPGQSLCRRVVGQDTDNNAVDFAVCSRPTPGW